MKKVIVFKIVSAPMVSSRDVVKLIARELKPYKDSKTDLDFQGIEFISRSAADELLNLKASFDLLEFTNLRDELVKLMRKVAAGKAYPEKKTDSFKPKRTTLSSMFA